MVRSLSAILSGRIFPVATTALARPKRLLPLRLCTAILKRFVFLTTFPSRQVLAQRRRDRGEKNQKKNSSLRTLLLCASPKLSGFGCGFAALCLRVFALNVFF
jgi:hypothetical protein